MNAQKAAALIKEKGIFGLGDYDGCMCCHFEVNGVHVDISCRKSSDGAMFDGFYGTTVRVSSRHMDSDASGLAEVAVVVIEQVQENEGHLPINLRFCDYEHDANGGKCVYCGKSRGNPTGYLCDGCQTEADKYRGGNLADYYAYEKLNADLIGKAAIPARSDDY